ncbi:helix-turn-helix domain-containing protein [Amycolatopsis sp. YIM 10]|uniref:AraC family transcriptional regulator n=1 Tax=Amycolatopsis sp. YIM 10 TaxID=2653857 RepID=UPI0012A8F917|nr:helix-turn-helix domain-containing protein [Amycolatopsis sp. YIM 10]QFU91522.1 transcriptional activator FtrA [Amycolatopsis sp. YIM 10]
MMTGVYRELPAPAPLRSVVRCRWLSVAGPGDGKRIVPDGCLDLIAGGDRVFVAGPDTGAWWSRQPPGTRLHGIRFRPGHAPRVLGVPADELRDQRIDLAELWGARGRRLTEQVLNSPADLIDVIGVPEDDADPALDVVLARLDRGVPRVSAALTGLDLGARQFRRRFGAAVGYGPATYLRVARLRRAIELAGDVPELATLAAEAGYADQAHLSRDCRELTGATPSAYFRSVQDAAARPLLRSSA